MLHRIYMMSRINKIFGAKLSRFVVRLADLLNTTKGGDPGCV